MLFLRGVLAFEDAARSDHLGLCMLAIMSSHESIAHFAARFGLQAGL